LDEHLACGLSKRQGDVYVSSVLKLLESKFYHVLPCSNK